MPVTTRSRSQKEVVDKRKENVELAKKYWWFCGHPTASIVNLKTHMHICQECPQSHDWEYFYVNGQLRTGT